MAKPSAKPLSREQRLVHARAAAAERRVEHVLEAAQDVVGVEHRVARDLPQPVGAVAEDVGERAGEHAHLAVERDHAAEAVRRDARRAVFFLDQREMPSPCLLDERQRRERRQRLAKHHRPRAGPAAAVRGREGLVQVDVHRVDAEVARAHAADDGVEVGAVAIDEPPAAWTASEIAFMSRSNRPQVLGLVIITAATSGPSRALSAARSTRPSAVAGMFSTAIAGEGGGRGIGAVRALGDQDDRARIAARFERRADARACRTARRARPPWGSSPPPACRSA